MVPFKTPAIVKKTWSKRIWAIPDTERTIYLTFDDGPIPDLTTWVLDTLAVFNAKATFFCVGENVSQNPDIFQRIVAEGHAVGNHTQHHINGIKADTDAYINNVAECDQVLADQNVSTTLFRPPYGRLKPSQQRALGDRRIIMWDVLSQDYNQNISPELILTKSIAATESGSIVVFHDNAKAEANLKYVLPKYLAHFSNLDYKFEAL